MPTPIVNELSPSQRLSLLLDESPLKRIQLWLWVLSTGGTLLDGFVRSQHNCARRRVDSPRPLQR